MTSPLEKSVSESKRSIEEIIEFGWQSVPSDARASAEEIEDAVLFNKAEGAFGVFDGLGGEMAGRVAANMARKFVAQEILKIPRQAPPEVVAEL